MIYDDSVMYIIIVLLDFVFNLNYMGVIFVIIFNDKYFILKLILVWLFFFFILFCGIKKNFE